MKHFQDQPNTRWKKVLYSKWVLLILIVFVIVLMKAIWGIYSKEQQSAQAAAQSAAQLAQMQSRANTLEESVNRLHTEEGIEEEIRSKYGVAKPGESVIVIEDSTSGTTTPTQVKQSWWNSFKGLFK